MITDIIAFFVFVISLLLSIILLYVTLQNPKTRKGSRREVLKKWVSYRLIGNPQDAIQAIRNQIIVNGAFVSALLVFTGLLVGLFSKIFTNTNIFFLNIFPMLKTGTVQVFVIGLCIVVSLFSFINSNRMATNLTFLITSKIDEKEKSVNELHLTQEAFRIMQRSWMVGIRGLFFLIAAITWLIHSLVFIICTLLILLYVALIQDFSIFERKK